MKYNKIMETDYCSVTIFISFVIHMIYIMFSYINDIQKKTSFNFMVKQFNTLYKNLNNFVS